MRTPKPPNLLRAEKMLPPPSQVRSEKRREQLKAAALKAFEAAGYERTSVGSICRRARLPVGTFYQHFRSKRQILFVLMDEVVRRLAALDVESAAAADVRTGISSLLSTALKVELHYYGVHRAWREAALSDPAVANYQRAIRRWTTRRVEEFLRALQRLPGARPDVDVVRLAPILDEMFWSLLFQVSGSKADERTRTVAAVTDVVYRAVIADGARPHSRWPVS